MRPSLSSTDPRRLSEGRGRRVKEGEARLGTTLPLIRYFYRIPYRPTPSLINTTTGEDESEECHELTLDIIEECAKGRIFSFHDVTKMSCIPINKFEQGIYSRLHQGLLELTTTVRRDSIE